MRYPDIQPGLWIQPTRGFRFACCDCGLVHKISFRIIDGKIQMKVSRDNRATGQIRRWRKIKIKEEDVWQD